MTELRQDCQKCKQDGEAVSVLGSCGCLVIAEKTNPIVSKETLDDTRIIFVGLGVRAVGCVVAGQQEMRL